MGIAGLLSFVREKFPQAVRPLNWELFRDAIGFSDTAAGVYNSISGRQPGDDEDFLQRMPNEARYLKSTYNINTFYVVDGERNPAKTAEEEWRSKNRMTQKHKNEEKVEEIRKDKQELEELCANIDPSDPMFIEATSHIEELNKQITKLLDAPTLNVSRKHYNNLTKILAKEGLHYIVGKTEAEKCCAWAVKNGLAQFVMSDDSDCLAYGSPVTVFNSWYHEDSYSRPRYFIVLEELLKIMNFDQDQLIQMCSLMHNDFNRGVALRGMGPVTAYAIISKHKTIENWRNSSDFTDFIKKKKISDEELKLWNPTASLAEFSETEAQISGLADSKTATFFKVFTSEELALEAVADIFEVKKEPEDSGSSSIDEETLKSTLKNLIKTNSETSKDLGRRLMVSPNPGIKKGPKRAREYTFGEGVYKKTASQVFNEREKQEDTEENKKRISETVKKLTLPEDLEE